MVGDTPSPNGSKTGSPIKRKVEDPKSAEEINLTATIKMLIDSQRETLKLLVEEKLKGNGTLTEEEKMDVEDQRIKEVELGKLEDLNGNAAIACGDWMHRIKPVICNLSRRAKQYWLLDEKIVSERYKSHLLMTPIEKLTKEIKDHEEADKEVYAKIKSIIHEMILKAIPKEIATEATQKRFEEPINLMLLIMIKYQPGSRKEKEAILQQIGSPEAGWTEEKALANLKLWKRKID